MKRALRCGAAAVEMAVVSPLLFTLVLGSIDFGRAIMVSNVVTTAAREGARMGAVPNATSSEVNTSVNSVLAGSGISRNITTVIKVNGIARDASTAVTGDVVTVSVSVPYGDVSWLPGTVFIGRTNTLNGQAAMRRE